MSLGHLLVATHRRATFWNSPHAWKPEEVKKGDQLFANVTNSHNSPEIPSGKLT